MTEKTALEGDGGHKENLIACLNDWQARNPGVTGGGLPLPPGYGTASPGSSALPPPPSGAGAPPSTGAKHSA